MLHGVHAQFAVHPLDLIFVPSRRSSKALELIGPRVPTFVDSLLLTKVNNRRWQGLWTDIKKGGWQRLVSLRAW